MNSLIPVQPELRFLQVGDRWEYEVTGAAQRGGRTLQLTGTITVTIEEREAGGERRLAIVFAQDRRIAGVPGPEGVFPLPAGVFYFEQDRESLDVRIAGDNMGPGGIDRFARVAEVFYPGRWTARTAYRNTLDFGPLGAVENSLCTVGLTTVSAPLGRYQAYEAPITARSPEFGMVEGTDYWTPHLGAPIGFEMVARAPDGSSLSTVARLRATNVIP